MKEYVLPKNSSTAQIGVLEGSDLNDVIALHETARAALPADRKMYILPQTSAYFQNLLMRQTGLMVGIRSVGKLIAQIAIMGPMELREAIALRHITNNDVPFPHAALTDNVVIFKSVAEDPAWRGNDLIQNLIKFALELPFTQIADHVFAQLSVGNKRSWDSFARSGFGIVAAAYDPKDGQPRFVFQKPSFGFDFAPAIIADDVDPKIDFPAIVTLTQREALIGIYEEDIKDKLSFMRSRDVLNLMPTLAKVHTQQA